METSNEFICGKCKHHRPYPTLIDEWYCQNEESYLFECETEYHDSCEAFEERKKK